MKNKILFTIFLLGVCAPQLVAKQQLQYRFSATVGALNRDDKNSAFTSGKDFRPVVLGGTFAIEFLPQGLNKSLRQWNNASVGLAVTALDLGQQQYFGQVIAPHAYINAPLIKTPFLILGLRPGLGVGFATKTYANTVPDEDRWIRYKKDGQQIANISIGSIANAWITAGIYMDFPMKNGWALSVTGAWQHLSNGSVMTPNAGYNMFNAELGATYNPAIRKNRYSEPMNLVPHHLYDGVKKNWAVDIGLAGGCRSVYYRDRTWYGVGTFSAAAFWIPVSIFRLGGGIDVYYDGAYIAVNDKFAGSNPGAPITYFGKTYSPKSDIMYCFRMGISLQPEMVLGNLTFGYHLGFYLYDPIKNMEPYKEAEAAAASGGLNRGIFYKYDPMKASTYQDGWFYQKLQLKYLCTKHLYVQLGLKLHIMKAEFIDAGLGIRI